MKFSLSIISLFICLTIIVEIFAEDTPKEEKLPKTEAQLDPYAQQRLQQQQQQQGYPYPGNNMYGNNIYSPYANSANSPLHFEFNCKCVSKSNPSLTPVNPLDNNAIAQQQIQTLQQQVTRLTQQLQRYQQGQNAFEQFAGLLSLADGLDCNCSGNSNSAMSNMSSMNPNMMSNRQNPYMMSAPNMQMGMNPFLNQRVAPGMVPFQ